MQATPSIETPPADQTSDRCLRMATGALLLAPVLFGAAAAASLLRHPTFQDGPWEFLLGRPTFEDFVGMFCAGAVPGLLLNLLLWSARPHRLPRPARLLLVAATLLCAALAAALPFAFTVTVTC
jgi:hypothetical protein